MAVMKTGLFQGSLPGQTADEPQIAILSREVNVHIPTFRKYGLPQILLP